MWFPRTPIVTLFAVQWCVSIAAAEELPNDFFERRIRPLLAQQCYECHGPEKQENELRLDRAADLFAGGASGRAIVPGKPDGSLLITAVRQTSDDLQMPPDGKLTDSQIADLVRWIELGAPHPEGPGDNPSVVESKQWQARLEHWAFQPPQTPKLPEVQDEIWVRTSVDHFILARLESEGLRPAEPADRRTLIRRATYDLIGLPPTPDEVAAFVEDDSPRAFAKVVDRLLASPHYGERWGRHWLDVVRYADSNGLDENVAHGNAWRYRDWVIDALNRDLPYDQFLQQQLAGDLLPAENQQQRNGHLIATGFLLLGPKVLAEVDERKMEMDIIDEQIDTVGRSMLGLTLGCARCHDHKFDPISAKDYYALAGIFKSTHSMDSFTKIARWHESELFSQQHVQAKAEHQRQLAEKRNEVEELIAEATAELQQALGEGAALPAKPEESFPPATRDRLKTLRDELAAIEKQAPLPPTAMGVTEAQATDAAVHVRGSHLTLGETVPRGAPRVLTGKQDLSIPADASGRLQLAQWLTTGDHSLTARVMVNRAWRWHFGRGLVSTTDNFGHTGSSPTHPLLLDHLATDFARDWSLKRLHRQIMLSAAYQTSSQCSEELKKADPHNRLLGRTSLRRLEAEAIRDAMLAMSGTLDRTPGGPVLNVENRKFLFDHTSKDETSYVKPRRSVYLPVVRNHLYEAFTLFDYTDASVPNGNRNTSTVASQALYLMNSEFVLKTSNDLAARLRGRSSETAEARIQHLYELCYGRPATENEVARAQAFLKQIEAHSNSEAGWALLCQSVLSSNEFFYLR